ncbi:MAG: hypothetical protein IJ317_04115 [Clostridia bacterium]|nr:hypothetical protein [Clostridia bacterium]
MVTVYNDADFEAVYNQKKRILGIFWGVTAVYLAICVAFLIYHISLPYADKMLFLPKLVVYIASGLYVIFAFPFLGIKFGRVRRYYKMMYYLSEGIKNEEICYFLCFEKKDLQKDWVDVDSCVFTTWNKKKSEWMEREAYFDAEKTLPDFKEGDLVKYIVQSNFIVQYDIVKRHAIEFEYEDDDDESVEDVEAVVEDGEPATGENTENMEPVKNTESADVSDDTANESAE